MSKLKNRGKEGKDDVLFGTPKMLGKIKEAVIDMQYLLSRGYGQKSSLQLVGNRHRLNARQQQAVMGMSASVEQVKQRAATCIHLEDLKGETIIIDGFNLIIIFNFNVYLFY